MNRIPRTKGTTYLSIRYNINKGEEELRNLKLNIVHNWILDGFLILNKPFSIEELSIKYQIEKNLILEYMAQESSSLNLLTGTEQLKSLASGILIRLTQFVMSDKARVSKQVDILTESQGEGYKAFVSPAVNSALDLNLKSNEQILKLFQALSPKQTQASSTNITIQNQQQNNSNYVTKEDAIKILHESGQTDLLLNKSKQEALFLEHNLGDCPQVIASGANENSMVGTFSKKQALTVDEKPILSLKHSERRIEEFELHEYGSVYDIP